MAPEGPATASARATLAGIGLMCLAVTSFALTDASAKWLSGHINVLMVVWARYAIHFVVSLAVFNPWSVPGLLRTRRPWLQLGRSALLFSTTALNFAALQVLQLDQTVSIMFSTPFFVALMAGPLLGEWVGARRWIAILVGFAGILLVVQPWSGGIHPAAFLSLAAAATYALYSITTRMLVPYDSSPTTLFYSALVGTIAASLPLPFVWQTPTEPLVYGGMLFLGAVAGAGHFVLILAHARAPAATLAPFIYTQIIAMVALGWLLFGQVPSLWTLAGAAVVIGSGIYLILIERKTRRRAP
jgi:drug/metabolite transporter (DMT)-like permease